MAKAKTTSAAKPTAPAADNKPAAEDAVIEKFIVQSAIEGFRRAGRAWSKEPVEVPAEELTAEQVQALYDEPNILVTPVAAE